MTVTAMRLDDALQALVDARLDTIDRMLMGHLPRRDRLAIVQDVEGQIDEMLDGLGTEGVTREALMSILARLDPPEAYIPEPEGREMVVPPRRVSMPADLGVDRRAPATGLARPAKASGIVGLISLVGGALGTVLGYVLALMTGSMVLFYLGCFGSLGAMLCGGTVAITLAACFRRGGEWATVGLVTGILAVVSSLMTVAMVFTGVIPV
ncbi:hypothetical protein EP7_002713 [Isosphaeraceae bacterium EP7]